MGQVTASVFYALKENIFMLTITTQPAGLA